MSVSEPYRALAEVPEDDDHVVPELYGRQQNCPVCCAKAFDGGRWFWARHRLTFRWDANASRLAQHCKDCGYTWASLPELMRPKPEGPKYMRCRKCQEFQRIKEEK